MRFPEFQGDWERKRLGDLCSKIGSGKTPKGGENVYQQTGISFIRSQNIKNNSLILDDTHIPYDIHLSMKGSMVLSNDILLNITGASIGRSCVVPSDFNEGNVNQHVSIIRLKKYNSYFLQSVLSSRIGQKLIFQGQTGSGREGLNFESIKNFKINFPQIEEQKKVASFLSLIEERIQTQSKIIENLESLMKELSQKIFAQELGFKDVNGNDFPNWERKKLGEIGEFRTSSVDKKNKNDEKLIYLVNYMNVYRHQSITNESKIDLMKVTASDTQISSNNLQKGDILFTPSSETPEDIGHSVVIFEDLESTLYSYHLMRFRPVIDLDILYSHYFCNVPNVLKQISRLATGSTRFTISVDSFSKVIIELPSRKEQTKIANFLSAFDEKIVKEKYILEQYQQQKKYLLQNLFI